MRKLFMILLAAVLVFSISTAAMAEETLEEEPSVTVSPTESTIVVSGSGETLVPADMAIISLGVSARNADVLIAQSKVNEAIAAIREALIADGVPAEDINTDFINIYAMYDYRDDQEELTAYNANSTLAIRTENMDKVGEIIDAAFGAGANTLNGISFSAKDTKTAEAEALKLAVANATEKAEVLAEAAGMTIAGIQTINESGTFSFDRGVMNNFSLKVEAAADAAFGTVVQAAKLTVSSNITITFLVH